MLIDTLFRSSIRPVASRRFSTIPLDTPALDAWITQTKSKSTTVCDTLTPSHLAALYVTLPTRDGTRGQPYQPLAEGAPLEHGHHLAFFRPRQPESALRHDGTDAAFCPPAPFNRRMWASGSVWWNPRQGSALRVGDKAHAVSTITSIDKKGFEDEHEYPMVFVKQRIQVMTEGRTEPSLVEERSHVFLASQGGKRGARRVTGLPKPDFSFTYTPSPTTLFRFSALTFNGHYIHLDKEYAQKNEGYPERLVHGPLTALMLLEVLNFYKPGLHLTTFEYRARNPVIVNRNSTIHGAFTGENKADVWCTDDDDVVGMTGSVTFSH